MDDGEIDRFADAHVVGHEPFCVMIGRKKRGGVALGADPLTFSGLAGIGDLMLTATGDQSRNRTFGLEIAKGKTVAQIKEERNTVAEGVNTSKLILDVASGVDVELDLGAIPYLDGARETVAAGITSTLQPQNLRLRRAISNVAEVGEDPRFPLIFDPQTAGGLLASVPQDRAEDCVGALRDLGYDRTAIIGTVLPEGNQLEPITVRG